MNKQKGFSAFEALIILLIIILLVLLGWFVWDKQKDKDEPKNTAASSEQEPEEAPALKEHKNTNAGISFTYPETWEVSDGVTQTEFGYDGIITVKHPDGLVVSIKGDHGGKGGACQDDPSDTPHNTKYNCSTEETLKQEKTIAKADYAALEGDVYLIRTKFTTGDEVGGKTTYNLILSSNTQQTGSADPLVGAWYDFGLISRNTEDKPPYIETTLQGIDRSDPNIFDQEAVKEAEDILRSLKLF